MKPGPKKQYEADLRVRVTAAAMEKIRRAAQEAGLTVSKYIRLVLGKCGELTDV